MHRAARRDRGGRLVLAGLVLCGAAAHLGCPRPQQTEDEMITLAGTGEAARQQEGSGSSTIGEAGSDESSPRCSSDGFCVLLGRGVEDAADPTTTELYGVWGSGPDDVYAVGLQGRLLHFREGELHNLTGRLEINDLWGVWGTGPDDVVVAASNGIVARYDGDSWQPGSVGYDFPLFDVWGSSSEELVAVGGPRAVMRRRRGEWREERLPRFDAPSGDSFSPALYGVWGTSSSNVYAVGDGGWVMRFDGRRWRNVESGTSATLRDVAGASEEEVWIVGDGGTALRLASGAFVSVGPRTSADLRGVWVGGWNEVYVVGTGGVIFLHNGRTWRSVDSGVEADLYAIWGQGDELWVVGDGIVLRRAP